MKSLSNIGYAALVLRMSDPGGTLPDDLLSYEAAVQHLRDACNALIDYRQANTLNFQLEKADDFLVDIRTALERIGEVE